MIRAFFFSFFFFFKLEKGDDEIEGQHVFLL